MGGGWRWFWRVIGLLAVVTSTASLALIYAFWQAIDVRPIAAGSNVTLDSLSLQLDLLALTMTAIGIGLGVIGLFGYQNIRDMAVAKAADEARRTAQQYIELDREAVGAYVQTVGARTRDDRYGGAAPPFAARHFDPAAVSTSGATKESRSDDERDRRDDGDRPASVESSGPDGGAGQ